MMRKIADAIYSEMDIADGLTPEAAERYAQAAIKALRELTDEAAMRVALNFVTGYRSADLGGLVNQGALNTAAAMWTMMLDEISKESADGKA